jgi:hypothetical protein
MIVFNMDVVQGTLFKVLCTTRFVGRFGWEAGLEKAIPTLGELRLTPVPRSLLFASPRIFDLVHVA